MATGKSKGTRPLPAPRDVVVRGLYTGTNVVKWKAPGVAYGCCEFVVEELSGGGWIQLAQVEGRKFNHMGQTPGVRKTYRVRAVDAARRSAASEAVSVYATQDWISRTTRPSLFRFTLDVAGGS